MVSFENLAVRHFTYVAVDSKGVQSVPSSKVSVKSGWSWSTEGKFSPFTVTISPPATSSSSGIKLLMITGTLWYGTEFETGINPFASCTDGSQFPATHGVTRSQTIELSSFELFWHFVFASLTAVSSSGRF